MVLALIVLPTIIIADPRRAEGGAALDPRGGAAAVGASKLQIVIHHVLPLAMPGILTGTIIGMAHALGETAPLLMIGMVAFIVDIPGGRHRCRDRAAGADLHLGGQSGARPSSRRPSAAIMVLLAFFVLMNGARHLAAPPVRAALVGMREEGTGYEPVDGTDRDWRRLRERRGAPAKIAAARRQRLLRRQAGAEERVDSTSGRNR